jgi:hypothetical protein
MPGQQEMLSTLEAHVRMWEETSQRAIDCADRDMGGMALAISKVVGVILKWNRPVPGGIDLMILSRDEASMEILDAIEQGMAHARQEGNNGG